MKKIFVFFVFWCFVSNSYASTHASYYAAQQYALENSFAKVHIVVKKEHTMDFFLPADGNDINAVTYGYGDMKIPGKRKFRVTYICLLDKNGNPVKSFIIPAK